MKLFVAIATMIILAGCGSKQQLVKHEVQTKSIHKNWYPAPDSNYKPAVTLSGKKIVLDPGHGGRFPGAVGAGGLTEKEINLRIALSLKAKLESVGASVFLTRTEDRDFTDSTALLKDDLFYRTRFTDSISPDLFISLHHNAGSTMGEDSSGDIIKTFYKMGDDGSSLDAAIRIHSSFVNMLGFDKNRLGSGNYSVLRKTSSPALLGEPSYISNPVVEKILKDTARALVEAEAYFRGIVDYFAGGLPKVLSVAIDSSAKMVVIALDDEASPDSFAHECYLDGRLLNAKVRGATLQAPLTDILSNGKHLLTVSVVNSKGAFSVTKNFPFVIDRPVQRIALFAARESAKQGQLIPVRVVPLDEFGMVVADGKLVVAGSEKALVKNGAAMLYLSSVGYPIAVQCQDASVVLRLPANPKADALCQLFVRFPGNRVVPAVCEDSASGRLYGSDVNGFVEFNSTITSVKVSASGFRDTAFQLIPGAINTVAMSPLHDGRILGKRIIIDPEFGGTETGYVSRSGFRSSDVTRKLARFLAGRMRLAGFEVIIARKGDESVHPSARVALANETGAEFYLVLRSDSTTSPYCAYYPGNAMAKRYANAVAEEFGDSIIQREEISYITQQTPCTAAIVNLISMHSKDPLDGAKFVEVADKLTNAMINLFKK